MAILRNTPAVDEISLPAGVPGRLLATSFSVVGPDPVAALNEAGADTLVCLITDHEIDMRFPDYAEWLRSDGHHSVLRLPTPDWGVTDDDLLGGMVGEIASRLRGGETVVTHCGAGLGRTGVLCALVLVALGRGLSEAVAIVRAGRPGSGAESEAQHAQLARLAPRLGQRA